MLAIGEGPINGPRMLTRLRRFTRVAALTVVLNLGANYQSAQSPDQRRDSDSRTAGSILNANERQRVIEELLTNLKQYYVYPELAGKMADTVRTHAKNGEYDRVTDGRTLAELLTQELKDVSHDAHLRVVYSSAKMPPHRPLTPGPPPTPPPELVARYRKEMEESNCTFEKVQILPNNVGYLKLNSFPDPSVCGATAAAMMAKLNQADAIIFDLRENGGGSPGMVALLATYLFDQPTHLTDFYNRAENSTQESWTLQAVPGNRLADKAAYVLTSASTFSGAEEFAYDLKMLKRATVVGETTRGGAHLVRAYPLNDYFEIAIPSARPINPISKTDWEGAGVQPDVEVTADTALTTAEKLALRELSRKPSRQSKR